MLIYLNWKTEHQALLAKLSAKDGINQQLDAISKQIDTKKNNIRKLTTTALSLKERSSEFTLSSDMADSRTAYAISLYAKISNITWDYSAPNGKLAGCTKNLLHFYIYHQLYVFRYWEQPQERAQVVQSGLPFLDLLRAGQHSLGTHRRELSGVEQSTKGGLFCKFVLYWNYGSIEC